MNGTNGMRTMLMPMMHGRMNSPTLKNTKVFPRIWNPLRTSGGRICHLARVPPSHERDGKMARVLPCNEQIGVHAIARKGFSRRRWP